MNTIRFLLFARSAWRALLVKDSWKDAGPADVLMVSADSKRGEFTREGKRFNRLLDTLGLFFEREGATSLHLSRPPSLLKSNDLWARSASLNRLYFVSWTLDLLFGRFLGDGLRWQRITFGKLLDVVEPKLVLAQESRGYMWQACEMRNIPLVEVLHGIGYINLSKTPTFSREKTEGLPPAIASFDRQSSESWLEMTGGKGGLIELRNFWLEEFLQGKSSLGLEKLLEIDNINTAGARYRVLVTLSKSPTSQKKKGGTPNWELLGLPLGLLEAMESLGNRAFWMIRLHPAQVHSPNPYWFRQTQLVENFFSEKKNVDVRRATRLPLPYLLTISSHHITRSSMASFEAAEFGVPTLSASPVGNQHPPNFSTLIESDALTLLGNSEFVNIQSWVKNRRFPSLSPGKSSFGVPPSMNTFSEVSRDNCLEGADPDLSKT